MALEHLEELPQKPPHPEHARCAHVDDDHPALPGDGAYRRVSRTLELLRGRDGRARLTRLARVEHHEGDPPLGERRLRRGMQHPGAEGGELRHLVVGGHAQRARFGNDARVRRHDSVHVRPDLHALGVHGRTQEGGGEVRSAATQGRGTSVAAAPDEALSDWHVSVGKQRSEAAPRQLADALLSWNRPSETVVRGHDLPDIEPGGGDAAARERSGGQVRAPQLSHAGQTVDLRGGQVPGRLLAELGHDACGLVPDLIRDLRREVEGACDLLVAPHERRQCLVERVAVGSGGGRNERHQRIRHAGERGHHHHGSLDDPARDDRGESPQGVRILDGRPPELHDDHRRSSTLLTASDAPGSRRPPLPGGCAPAPACPGRGP